jgi:hypothetical protein
MKGRTMDADARDLRAESRRLRERAEAVRSAPAESRVTAEELCRRAAAWRAVARPDEAGDDRQSHRHRPHIRLLRAPADRWGRWRP